MKDNQDTAVDVTKTVSDADFKIDFRSHFAKTKWSKKAEFDLVKDVRDRFKDMEFGRSTSCFWAEPPSEGGSETNSNGDSFGTSGTDWVSRWNLDYKLWSQWHEYLPGRSNLKSPISLAPVEAFMAEFYKSPSGVVLTETTDEDKTTAKVIADYVEYLESNGIDKAKKTSAKECVITGTSILYNGYLHQERQVEFLLTGNEIDTEIDKTMNSQDQTKIDAMNKRLKEEKKPLTKSGTIVDYDDAVIIPVNIYEFYIDENARCIEGFSHEAIDCVWRTTPSLEQFRAEFVNSNDAFIIKDNIDKVKDASTTAAGYNRSAGGTPFFQLPSDIQSKSNRVEVLKYYNKETDKFLIIANDIVIRDGPLPYNHKKLPFSVCKFVDFPHQFYGIGIPVLLESLQAEDETLRNLAIMTLKKLINPAVFINSQVFGQIDTQWDRVEAGMKIEIDGPVAGNIEWDRGPANIHFGEIMQMRADLHNDAILASGINSIAEAMPQQDQAVRNNLMSQASTQLMMSKGMENWAMGYVDSIKQIIPVIQQILPNSYTVIKDENDKEIGKEYKKIRVSGKRYVKTVQGMDIEPVDEDTDVELTPEMIKSNKKILVQIDTDRLTPVSRGMKVQNVQNAIQFLAPIISNPQMMQAPGMPELIHDYVDFNGLSKHIYDKIQQADSSEDTDLATNQEADIEKGKVVPGIPGESDAHKLIHYQATIDDVAQRDDPKTSIEIKQQIQERIMLRSQHLQVDNTDKMVVNQMALSMAQPPQPPQGMMPPQGMAPQSPMPMGDPNQMGMPSPQQSIAGAQPGNVDMTAQQGQAPQGGLMQ